MKSKSVTCDIEPTTSGVESLAVGVVKLRNLFVWLKLMLPICSPLVH